MLTKVTTTNSGTPTVITKSISKPPIGLLSKNFWDEKIKVSRLKDIEDAISRYVNGKCEIPVAWIEEYNDLIKQI